MAYGIAGQPVPLFDRLIDNATAVTRERTPTRVYGEESLQYSVGRDLQRLLNTRSAGLIPDFPTVLDYGVPDFVHLYAASLTDRATLAESVRAAIVAYEPRLLSPVVTFAVDATDVLHAIGAITGRLQLEQMTEPVSFAILAPDASGETVVELAGFPSRLSLADRRGA